MEDLGIIGARNAAIESDEYKNSPYKIGDKIHLCEGNVDCDCTLSDAMRVYDPETFNPVIVYCVRFEDGRERKIKGLDSIKFKY